MDESATDQLKARLELLFREELQDNLGILAAGLARLEARPDGEAEAALLPDLFRAAHSLKGAAHSAGVTGAVAPCHDLESLLAALRDGAQRLDDAAFATYADALDQLGSIDRQLGRDAPAAPAPRAVHTLGRPSQPAPAADVLAASRARIAVSDLDELIGRAGALVAATERLHRLSGVLDAHRDDGMMSVDELERIAGETGGVDRELTHAARSVADTAQRLRMQRIGDITAGLEHTVRELARSLGKHATLVVDAGELKVDRDVGDALRDPLLHLVRNAVDHGLEPPDDRATAGKPAMGTVRIEAALDGGRMRISVADDGRGVDVTALRSRADAGGSRGDDATDVELAFRAGLSTADAVTDVSGRGVGLDAVRARIESLGGSVQLRSGEEPDGAAAGTVAVMHVPTTLAVVAVVLVRVGDDLVGLPAAAVDRARRVVPEALQAIEGRLLLVDGDRTSPAVSLGATLGIGDDAAAAGATVTIVELVDDEAVLVVDGVVADVEGVLHRLPPRATSSTAVLGALVLPGDRAALVLNPAACVRAGAQRPVRVPTAATSTERATVLLVEDTLTTRALERSILVGAGYEVIDVADGAAAWEVLQRQPVDLVVSDVDMPRMGGIELCRAIRSSAQLGQVPVVLVTSMASDDDRRRGAEAGATAYLVKSVFDQRTLLDAVRRLL